MRITTDIDLALREAVALFDPAQVYILTDSNSAKYCLPTILNTLSISQERILTIPSGDDNKNLQTLTWIWEQLSNLGATRKSLLLNLGGGMITDIGGFAAATFKRGMSFVNISTTLLGAVDAATGGKCGINFNNLKNEIGIIKPANEVIIYPPFFSTLTPQHFLAGYAEMLKHGLISSPIDTNQLLAFPIEEYLENADKPFCTDDLGDQYINPIYEQLIHMIRRSLEIKQYIVDQDIEESSLRKSLNFGHTIGHALEELSLQQSLKSNPQKTFPLLHGYAVMYGMVAELYLSVIKLNFPKEKFQQIVRFMVDYYGKPQCACDDYEKLYQLMLHDKKNLSPTDINFTLLANVGNPRINQTADKKEIFEALDYVMNL